MPSNLYGYNDYSGPQFIESSLGDEEELTASSNPIVNDHGNQSQQQRRQVEEDDDEDEHDPLRSGLWMEGASRKRSNIGHVIIIKSTL
jgi:hypothetical protein